MISSASIPGPWENAAPSSGVEGSIPNADFFPAVMGELLNVQDEAGLTRNSADTTQVLQAIRSGKLTFFVDTGTADALVVTPRTAYTALAAGTPVAVLKGAAANATTTPTLSVNGLVRQLCKEDGTALAVGDLPASDLFLCYSDGSKLRVIGLRKSDIAGGITSNITNIAPLIFNAQQTVTSFTPVVVFSDLTYNAQTVIKSIAIPTGASFIQGFGQLAYRNDSSSRIDFITSLRLTGSDSSSVDSPYIGGGMPAAVSTGGIQSAQPVNHAYRNLNKAVTYTLNLMGLKTDNASPLVVLDGYIEASYA